MKNIVKSSYQESIGSRVYLKPFDYYKTLI